MDDALYKDIIIPNRIKHHEHWIEDPQERAEHMRNMTEVRMKPIRLKRWLERRMANLKTKEDVKNFELKPWDILAWEQFSSTNSPHGDEIFLNEVVPKLKKGLIRKINREEKIASSVEKCLKRLKTSDDQLDSIRNLIKTFENDKRLLRAVLQIIDIKNPNSLRNFQISEAKKKSERVKREERAERKKLKKKVKRVSERGRKERLRRLRRREEERDMLLPRPFDSIQEALADRIRKVGFVKKTWNRGDLYDKVHAYRAGRERWNRVLRLLEIEGILMRRWERRHKKGRKNETITFL